MSGKEDQSLNNEKKLWMALSLTTIFIGVELAGSIISNSLALLSDAAHLFTDAVALIISIMAVRLGRKKADKKRTFGYYRLEILAAAFNASILFVVAFYIIYEAYERLYMPHPVQTSTMLIVASIGLIINFTTTRLLHAASKESLNIKSAYVDAEADMLSSLAVILTALLIQMTHWQYLDSLLALGVSMWILPRSWSLLKESINILLEGVPEGIELNQINDVLLDLPGVLDVHDLHVWALTNGKISLSAHIIIDEKTKDDFPLLEAVIKLLEEKFAITHSTIQIETLKCEEKQDLHRS